MENQDIQQVEEPEIVETSAEPEQAEQQPDTETSKPKDVPLKVLESERRKRQEAESRIAEMERKNAALEQERNLQQLVIPQHQEEPELEAELTPPDRFDFSDHDEWLNAQRQYLNQIKETTIKHAAEQTEKILIEREQKQVQSQLEREQAAQREKDRQAYLDRADTLEAPDFLEKEDALREAWSPWFFDEVMSKFDNSEQVVYALGSDIEKAVDLAEKFDSDNFRGGLELVKFAASLGQSKTDPLPEPDEPIAGGSGNTTDIDSKIEELRKKKLAGDLSMQQFMDQKRELLSRVN